MLCIVFQQAVIKQAPGDGIQAQIGFVKDRQRRAAGEADDAACCRKHASRERAHSPVQR